MSLKRLLAIALLICWSPVAEAECSVAKYSAVSSTTSSTTMIAETGQTCSTPADLGGAPVESLKIEIPPRNGTASVDGTHFAYKSIMGFTGADKFVVAITSQHRDSTLTVNVNVIP